MSAVRCPKCGGDYDAAHAGGLCPRCLAEMAVHPTAEPPDELPLAPGQAYHGLEVERLVARGGMGIVYKARQPHLDRAVALKILPRRLAGMHDFKDRFVREARALAGLSHRNIVTVYDFGIEQDLSFLVMEYIDGVTLRQVLRHRRLTPQEAVKIVHQVCDALDYAHSKSVVHRDIKPENIMIDRAGQVKITDFGLAMILGVEVSRFTETNLVIGTPHYMAPEQLERPKEVDHRADIYSFGVVLYEMLTGELPIGRFEPPSAKGDGSPRLDPIVMKTLEKDPDRRYQRVSELKRDVARATSVQKGAPAAERARFARNLPVHCSCGRVYYVADHSPGPAPCPSCGAPNLAKAGTARRMIADIPIDAPAPPAPRASRGNLILLSAGSGLLTVLLGLLFWLLLRSERPAAPPPVARNFPEPFEPSLPPQGPVLRVQETEPPPPARKETPLPPPSEAIDPNDPLSSARFVDQLVARGNVGAVAVAVLAHGGRAAEAEKLRGRLRDYDRELHGALRKAEAYRIIRGEIAHIEPDDRVTGFAGKELDPNNPAAFAEELKGWLKRFRPGHVEQCFLTRGLTTSAILLYFPEQTRELELLAREAGVTLGESAVAPEGEAARDLLAIPADLVGEVRARMGGLPPFYRQWMSAEEHERARKLAEAGRGTPEDVDFLSGRVLAQVCARADDEMGGFRIRVTELEGKMPEWGAADVIHFKDGRRVEATVVQETEQHVRIKTKHITVSVSRADIQRIERGKAAATEFPARYAAARGNAPALEAVLRWCQEKALAPQKDLAAYAILILDPGHDKARQEVGLARGGAGGSREPDVSLLEGKVQWQGVWYAPEELNRKLKSLGYVQANGLWCERVSATYRVDNLYRDEKKLVYFPRGAGLLSELKTARNMAYNIQTKQWVEQTSLVPVARYLGVTTAGPGAPQSPSGQGEVDVQIDAPGDILTCRVKATAQVYYVGGYVSVSVVNDLNDGLPKRLYTLGAVGSNDSTYDVSEKVAGRARFFIRAELRSNAMFLPGDANDHGLLEVRYTYARPLDRLNAALGLKPPIAVITPNLNVDNEATERAANLVAENVTRNYSAIGDALSEILRVTGTYYYGRDVVFPVKYSALTDRVRDPLRPRLEELPAPSLAFLEKWWRDLLWEDRRDAAAYYALWAARTRTQRALEK